MINIIINDIMHYLCRGRRGHDRMQLPMHSVPITTDVLSSNLDQGEGPRNKSQKDRKYNGSKKKEK
jgi:hypothetical protein